MSRFEKEAGDTVLTRVPADYACGGDERWFVVGDGPDAGRRLYFWDRRLSDGDGPTVLLVHGNPECSYTFRKVVNALEGRTLPAGTRLIAMDHIGFGRSDQATFEMVEMHHAENLAQFLEALDLRNITLVVHDWGGPIGVGAALRTPERVSNLVVLNTSVFPMPMDGITYANWPRPIAWAKTPALTPDRLWGALAAWAVTFPRKAGQLSIVGRYVRFAAGSLAGRLPGPYPATQVFHDQFGSVANVRMSKRMVAGTPVYGHGYSYVDPRLGPQDNGDFYRDIQERIGQLWGPSGQAIGVGGIFGDFDPLGKASVVAQWLEALPQMEENLTVIPDGIHFIEEQHPEPIADVIAKLLHPAA